MEENKNMEPLASEMYQDLKRANDFNKKMIYILLGIIVALIIALAWTNIYHIQQWSQFDTVVVETGEGDGNANYVGGENTGGIYNGESSGTPQEESQQGQGLQN